VNVPFAKVALPGVPTEPMSPSDQPTGSCVTVNEDVSTLSPFTVTENGPEDAPDGTTATIVVSLQVKTAALVPLSETVLPPCVTPKFTPVMVTELPTGPEVGDRPAVPGDPSTVKYDPLLATPDTVITTFPLEAPVGTAAKTAVALQLVTLAVTPLNVTVLVPCVVPKFVPAIEIEVPANPEAGERLVMLGAGSTVKPTPLLDRPDTVTTTFPVVAPVGTSATMFVELQLEGVAVVPLNVTVLDPCVEPKLVPVIVTEEPTAADVGERLVMLGAETTVKLTPLLFTPLANTTTFPVVAPDGTVAMMLVALQLVTVAAVPLKVTVPLP
jgi:hypothetical protein